MSIVLKGVIHFFALVSLELEHLVVHVRVGQYADDVALLLLPDSVRATNGLLLGRDVPPWIQDDDSVSAREIERLTTCLQANKLFFKRSAAWG